MKTFYILVTILLFTSCASQKQLTSSYVGSGYIITFKPNNTFDYVHSWNWGHSLLKDSAHGIYKIKKDSLFLNYAVKVIDTVNVRGIIVKWERPQFVLKKNNEIEIKVNGSTRINLKPL